MKTGKKLLSILLALCLLCQTGTTVLAAGTEDDGSFYKILFLDCGRKYFSVDNIKALVDNASAAGLTHVQLAVGNDGLRFLPDDLSLTVGKTVYASDTVKAGIHAGNEAYSNFTTDELTEAEMDAILAYAAKKDIKIIPCVNSPGHMDAILDCMEYCGLKNVSYGGSARTVDVTNAAAVAFTQALLEKYIAYFASRGCTLFNMGADEYANDVYQSGSMGFGELISNNQYSSFVDYVNAVSALIKSHGMTPMAFNDGIYFNGNTSGGTFDTDILICYWSSGWNGYSPMSASKLREKGFRLINTNGDYYWVLGKSSWQCSATKAAGFSCNAFQGSTIEDPAGAMLCIWCDYPQADSDSNVVSATADVVAAFGTAMPREPVTEGSPFPAGTAGSRSFRIPSLVSLSDGTLVAAADARWDTLCDGGGLDTISSYSADGGATWHYSFANYLGDNGDTYNGKSSTAFIDPCMAVTADDTIYLLCDLYPYGVALNGNKDAAPSTSVGFDSSGNLLLKKSGENSFGYYLDLSNYKIYSSNGYVQSGYTVDEHFNITYSGGSSNLFYQNAPFTVVRTGYLYLVRSEDGGKSWSAPRLLNLKTTSEMACLAAPGASIVTEAGTIVFPVYSYNGSDSSQRVSFLYSADGVSWSRSPSLSYSWGSESACVELAGGTLRFFFRNGTGKLCYADALWSESGYTWQTPVQTTLSINSNTQLSAIRYSRTVDGHEAILVSCPTNSASRADGKIFVGLVAQDGSMTWPYSMAVESRNSAGQFAYSCLTEMESGNIALLYEDYSSGWESGQGKISFAAYTMQTVAPGAEISAIDLSGTRQEILFNESWLFSLGTADASAKNYDDSTWQQVDLPHDFSISQSFTTSGEAESGFLPGGTGWYRKHFTMDASQKEERVLLNFDGVYSDAYVYVNGAYVGEHHYGYSSFAMDISDALIYDGETENVVAVKVVHDTPSSRWYSGSGIYRDVKLITTGSIHVALNGTAVTTPDVAAGTGTVEVTTEIQNESIVAAEVTARHTVYEKGGTDALATVDIKVTVPAGKTVTAERTLTVLDYRLWSVDAPALYTVVTELLGDETALDSYETDFGFRWYTFDGTKGFSLNGEPLKLNGVCLHHDQGALGSAAETDAMRRQLTIMKDMGVNAIRTSHNPADEDFIALCNEMGFLVIEEAFDGWSVAKNGNSNDFSRYFNTKIDAANGLIGADSTQTWAQFAITSMVRRDRNAPCIILWSLGNEIQEGASTSSSFPTIAQNLCDWVRTQDDTHPVTLGDNTRPTSASSVLGQVLQVIQNNGGVVGFNYASGDQLNSLHNAWGTIYSSETTSATNSRGIYTSQAGNTGVDGQYHLTAYDTSTVSWGKTAHQSIYDTMIRDYVAGEFVWTGFDYIGEPTPYNKTTSGSQTGSGAIPNSSYFGIVDTAGFPKDTYYLYRSQWNQEEPTLHLVTAWDSDNMLTTAGETPVVIYTNAARVELYRNDVLIGTARRTVHTTSAGHSYYTYTAASENKDLCTAVSASAAESLYATFRVAYAAGTIRAVAYDEKGNDITALCEGNSAVTTPGEASALHLRAERVAAAEGDLVYVTAEITDAAGTLDTTADREISFSLSGDGEIMGVDNGDQATLQKYQQPSVLTSHTTATVHAYAGKALVILRATGSGGMTLTASGTSLFSDSISVATDGQEAPLSDLSLHWSVTGQTVNYALAAPQGTGTAVHLFAARYSEAGQLVTCIEADVTLSAGKKYGTLTLPGSDGTVRLFAVDNASYVPIT